MLMGNLSKSYLKDKFLSTKGYKRNSPDVNNPYNVIPSNQITMRGVDFPVLGVDNMGNRRLMEPGNDYTFPGNYVTEFPMKNMGNSRFQVGGTIGIPMVNGQVVSSQPQPLTSVRRTRGPIQKNNKGDVKTMPKKAVKHILKNIR
jgi:hypothetical protein